MDQTTQKVLQMYRQYPYPSSDTDEGRLKELANLLGLFSFETNYDFKGKSILDAGTGTGHRLVTAAKMFPDTKFFGVDISEKSLCIAKVVAERAQLKNVEFRQHNLMDGNLDLGQKFDLIMCMGVLHHLSDPITGLRHLTSCLAEDGILFLYLYGALGSRERMRRKEVVSHLLQGEIENFEIGIQMIKDLSFDSFEYGWNLNVDDQLSIKGLIVDTYLHLNEKLYDFSSICELMGSSSLYRFMTYGITCGRGGFLFETGLDISDTLLCSEMSKYLHTKLLIERYEALSLVDKYRLVELFYQPNGYTVLGYTEMAAKRLDPSGRITRNSLPVKDL